MKKHLAAILILFLMTTMEALAFSPITGGGGGGGSMTYPGAGLPIAGSGAWGTSLTPLLGNFAQGVTGPVWGVSAYKVPTSVCGAGVILTSNGTDFVCSVGFTVDADGDVIAKSITITKQSGVAGDMGLYEANSTDVHSAGFRGPASISGDGAYRLTFPNARPGTTHQVLACTNAAESGSGTAADPYVQTCAWESNGAAATPTVITVADSNGASDYVALFESATGDLAPKTDPGIRYDATTGTLTIGALTITRTDNPQAWTLYEATSDGNNYGQFVAPAKGVGLTGNRIYTLADHSLTLDNITTGTTTNLTGILVGSSGAVAAVTAPTGAVVGTTDTQTLSGKTLTAPKETVVTGGTCSTSYTPDLTAGSLFTLTLNGACAINNPTLAAGESFMIKLTQSSTTAPTWGNVFKWPAGTAPTWSTSATKYDVVACVCFEGTALQCSGIVDVR